MERVQYESWRGSIVLAEEAEGVVEHVAWIGLRLLEYDLVDQRDAEEDLIAPQEEVDFIPDGEQVEHQAAVGIWVEDVLSLDGKMLHTLKAGEYVVLRGEIRLCLLNTAGGRE